MGVKCDSVVGKSLVENNGATRGERSERYRDDFSRVDSEAAYGFAVERHTAPGADEEIV